MDIFDYNNYKYFTRDFLETLPNKGRGQLTKMAQKIGVNSSLMSQVFNGNRELTETQAYDVAQFLALNSKETFYYILLVQKQRAGHIKLKNLLEEQIKTMQKDSRFLKNRMTPEKELTSEQQAIFYSNWILTAIYTLSSIQEFGTVHEFSAQLKISPSAAKKATDILLDYGLCIEKEGRITSGPKSTFIPGDSPHVSRHHANWRIQALEKMEDYYEDHFHLTMPFTISKSDYEAFRKELVILIQNLSQKIEKTPVVEQAACLNIDFFKF